MRYKSIEDMTEQQRAVTIKVAKFIYEECKKDGYLTATLNDICEMIGESYNRVVSSISFLKREKYVITEMIQIGYLTYRMTDKLEQLVNESK